MKDSQNSKKKKVKNDKKIPVLQSNTFVLRRWYLYVLLFILVFAASVLLAVDHSVLKRISKLDTLKPSLFEDFSASLYPMASYNLSSENELLADAGIVVDDESKVVLFEKNATKRFPMASTAKIMTAIVALDYYKPSDILTIKEDNVEGSEVGFTNGEKHTVENFLYGLLLPSGNDAALALAQNFPGGEAAFVEKMNEEAQAYHMFNTRFADASGLLDDAGYTTSLDLARLASQALKNPVIAQIVSASEKTIRDVSGTNTYKLENLNKLLEVEGVEGIKTGFTDKARGILVTSKIEKGKRFITVVMRSEDRFADTKYLFSILPSVTFLSIHP